MTDLTISDELCGRIKRRLSDTEFESVDEYVEFVLSEVVSHVEHNTDVSQPGDSSAPRDEIQARLESLGYLEG